MTCNACVNTPDSVSNSHSYLMVSAHHQILICVPFLERSSLSSASIFSHCSLFFSFKTLLLLLSHFNYVQLCAAPQMATHQAPLSLGFPRQEYWSGLPFPSPMHACMLSHFSCVRLCVSPWTAAHQARLSTGFSRQEYWVQFKFYFHGLITVYFLVWYQHRQVVYCSTQALLNSVGWRLANQCLLNKYT